MHKIKTGSVDGIKSLLVGHKEQNVGPVFGFGFRQIVSPEGAGIDFNGVFVHLNNDLVENSLVFLLDKIWHVTNSSVVRESRWAQVIQTFRVCNLGCSLVFALGEDLLSSYKKSSAC